MPRKSPRGGPPIAPAEGSSLSVPPPTYGYPPPYTPPSYYPPPGWAPPPRLPEASFGNLFTGTFRVFFKDLAVFFLVYAVLSVVVGAIAYGLAILFFGSGILPGASGAFFGIPDVTFTFTGLPSIGVFVALMAHVVVLAVLAVIISSVVTGAMTHFAVQRLRGTAVTAGGAFEKGLERLPSVLGAQLLLNLLIIGTILAPIVGLLAGGYARNFAVVGLSALAILVLIPVVIFVSVSLSLNAPAIMMEGVGALDGLRRSWALTRGRRFSIFGAMFIIGLLAAVVALVGSSVSFAYPDVAVSFAVNVFVQGVVGSWAVILAAVAYDLILKERARWAAYPPYPWPYYPQQYPTGAPPPAAPPPSAPAPSPPPSP